MNTTVWNIDPSHSSIAFTIRHMVFAKVRGQFTRWSGHIEMVPEELEKGRVEVVIDAASIDTATEKRDEHLRSADFLDVDEHPEIHFRSTRIEVLDDNSFRLHGELSIHGVTRSVVLDGQLTGRGLDPWGNQRVGFSATSSILRSDFGLTWSQALETGGVLVGDKLDIELELQAVEAAAEVAA